MSGTAWAPVTDYCISGFWLAGMSRAVIPELQLDLPQTPNLHMCVCLSCQHAEKPYCMSSHLPNQLFYTVIAPSHASMNELSPRRLFFFFAALAAAARASSAAARSSSPRAARAERRSSASISAREATMRRSSPSSRNLHAATGQ